MSIPISEHEDDFLAWHFDNKGLFSVKSAYKVHVNMLRREAHRQSGQGSTSDDHMAKMFAALWKTTCPPKVHHFLWRLAHNSYPMYMNISRRGVELDTRCAVCGKLFEDGGHLFLNCKLVKQRWRALLMEEVRILLSKCSSAKEVVQAILTLPEERRLMAIALLWCWWHERNKGRHGDKHMSTEEFQFTVRRHVSEWMEFLKPKAYSHSNTAASWERPPLDMVKINVDGAFSAATGKGGWGFICRDSAADVQFAAAGAGQNYANALHAETDALHHAVSMADHLGVGRAVLKLIVSPLQMQ